MLYLLATAYIQVMTLSCATGGTGWILGTISSPKEQCCSGTAAQGGGGVTVPGGVPELWGCGTEGCGYGHGGGGLGLDLEILVDFSNLNVSMIHPKKQVTPGSWSGFHAEGRAFAVLQHHS